MIRNTIQESVNRDREGDIQSRNVSGFENKNAFQAGMVTACVGLGGAASPRPTCSGPALGPASFISRLRGRQSEGGA